MNSRLYVVSILTLAISLLGCAGSSGPKPDWETAPDVDISAYSTFAWADGSRGPPVAILDNQVRSAIRAQLLQKGYVETADAADFIVRHETIESETVKQSNPVTIGIGIGSWGRNVGGSVGTSVGVGGKEENLQHNRVTIRALATESDREVWVGITTTLEERPDAPAIDRAIAGVMQGFPDKR